MSKHSSAILVCTPYYQLDDPAVVRAASIAERTGARLTLVDVLKGHPQQGGAQKTSKLGKGRAFEQLEARAQKLAKSGLDVDAKILRGQPTIELVKEVKQNRYDLLIWRWAMDDQPRSLHNGPRGRLLRACPCPVWMARREGTKIDRVMILYDEAEERKALKGVVEAAVDLQYAEVFEESRGAHSKGADGIATLIKTSAIDLLVTDIHAPKGGLDPAAGRLVELVVRGGRCSILTIGTGDYSGAPEVA